MTPRVRPFLPLALSDTTDSTPLDYVYSSWNESKLRQYLQDKGLVEPHAQTTKEQLLAKMKTAYLKSTDPIWNAWTDSYIVS
jgi:hypothetical protein